MKKIIVLFLIAFALRVWFVSDHNIIFWYDSARDAIKASQIWQGNLTLMGPTASGTNDSVYHGALYYYLLAPWYGISNGDPAWPTYFLAFLGAVAVPLNYWLGYSITKNKLFSSVYAGAIAFSSQAVILSTLLTNPTMALVMFPLFFLCVWKLFFEGNTKIRWWILLGFSYGWFVQSVIWLFPLLFIPIISAIMLRKNNPDRVKIVFRPRSILISLFVATLMVSSMLFTQFKLYKAGIFTPQNISEGNKANQRASMQLFTEYLTIYGARITSIYFPSHSIIALLFFGYLLTNSSHLPTNRKQFYLLLFASPIFISVIFPRKNEFFFYMMDIPLYLFAIDVLFKNTISLKKPAFILLMIIFVATNIFELQYYRNNHLSVIDVWGTTLSDSIRLVEETYKISKGAAFSIDSFTDPYKYNTVWSYLYSWYGKDKYGYTPTFIGSSQIGTVNEGLLSESSQAEAFHFAIIQPNPVISQQYFNDFLSIQQRKTDTNSLLSVYGTTKLLTYNKEINSKLH